jgi:hypothetical protein
VLGQHRVAGGVQGVGNGSGQTDVFIELADGQ